MGGVGIAKKKKKKKRSKLYAMKVLSKRNIMKRKQVEHTNTERRVLGFTRHPFIVQVSFLSYCIHSHVSALYQVSNA